MAERKFGYIKTKVLNCEHYYDGPLTGLCEGDNKILYFAFTDEIDFSYIGNRIHSPRIFTLFDLPKEITDILIFNDFLYIQLKKLKILDLENFKKMKLNLPEDFQDSNSFLKNYSQYAVGYTIEDLWDDEEFYKNYFSNLTT